MTFFNMKRYIKFINHLAMAFIKKLMYFVFLFKNALYYIIFSLSAAKRILLKFFIKNFFFFISLIFNLILNVPFFLKQIFLILKKKYLFFIDILIDNTILLNILKKKLNIYYEFYNREKEDFLACIEYELDLISTKWSTMKTFKDAWHIFFRHFLVPLFLLLGTAYIVGVVEYALIGLTYEHFGYYYNGKFPFTKF